MWPFVCSFGRLFAVRLKTQGMSPMVAPGKACLYSILTDYKHFVKLQFDYTCAKPSYKSVENLQGSTGKVVRKHVWKLNVGSPFVTC
jgi:hypothetical protein